MIKIIYSILYFMTNFKIKKKNYIYFNFLLIYLFIYLFYKNDEKY